MGLPQLHNLVAFDSSNRNHLLKPKSTVGCALETRA